MPKTYITVVVAAMCTFAWCRQPTWDWQVAVKRYAEAKDWNAAMAVVDSEKDRTPQNIEVLTWRARLLSWSGRLQEAEQEWKVVMSAAPTDPDNWVGLANVYWRQGRPDQALQALNAAVKLDSRRADIHLARARALQALHDRTEAKLEYRKVLDLEPTNAEAKAGLLSFRTTPKNQLLAGTNTDLLSFASTYEQSEVSFLTQWSSHWKTEATGDIYQRGVVRAEKAGAKVTASSSGLGALTVGGTAAHDNGIISRNEFLFEFDHGFAISDNRPLRAIEVVYGQHWYWYSTTHIMAINETTSFYFPSDWTWSLRLIGSRSQFNSTGPKWSPSGTTKLGFPIIGGECHHLSGNVFFAVGTENFSQVDQIGSSYSRTYGGGIHLQLTPVQDVAGYGAYQTRSGDQRQTSFGATYGLRF